MPGGGGDRTSPSPISVWITRRTMHSPAKAGQHSFHQGRTPGQTAPGPPQLRRPGRLSSAAMSLRGIAGMACGLTTRPPAVLPTPGSSPRQRLPSPFRGVPRIHPAASGHPQRPQALFQTTRIRAPGKIAPALFSTMCSSFRSFPPAPPEIRPEHPQSSPHRPDFGKVRPRSAADFPQSAASLCPLNPAKLPLDKRGKVRYIHIS